MEKLLEDQLVQFDHQDSAPLHLLLLLFLIC